MPEGFKAAAAALESRLFSLNRELPGIILIEKNGGPSDGRDARRYALLPQSERALVKSMIELGFDAAAAAAWVSRPEFVAGEKLCLQIAEPAGSCVDVWISLSSQPSLPHIDLMTADNRTLMPSAANASYGLIGSSALSLGKSGGGIQAPSDYVGFSSRAIASRGATTFEYDLSASSQRRVAPIPAESTTVVAGIPLQGGRIGRLDYRVLVAGRRMGDYGRVYAGYFPAASSGFQQSGGNLFFGQASMVGMAFKTDGAALNQYGSRQRVRLQLASEQQVRILSGGAELFSGVVGGGEQYVEFDGYAEPFVEVQLRDSLGRVERRSVEVMAPASAHAGRMVAAAPVRSVYYLDAGVLLSGNEFDNRHLRTSDVHQASFFYQYSGDERRYQWGAQSMSQRRRLAFSMSGLASEWRLASMAGNQGEYGLSGNHSLSLPLGVQVSASAIRYRAPRNGGISGASVGSGLACLAGGNTLCYSSTDYGSLNISLSAKDFPLRLGWYAIRSPYYSSRQVTLSAASQLQVMQWTSSIHAFASYDTVSGAKALFVALIIPMENEIMVNSSVSANGEGRLTTNAGFARSFENDGDRYLRSVSLGVSQQNGGGGAETDGDATQLRSGTAAVLGNLGPVTQSSSVVWSSQGGGFSANTVLSASYAADAQGISYADRTAGAIGTQLFNDGSSAGISILNRSDESQRISVDGTSYEVAARTSRFLPRSPGRLDEVQASPGPVTDPASAQARTFLHRGNVRTVAIADGFWAIESFEVSDGAGGLTLLSPEHTYKFEGAEIVRLYPDSRLRSLVYETRDDARELTRFITVPGRPQPLRCRSREEAGPGDGNQATAYRPLRLLCEPAVQAQAQTQSQSKTESPGR